MQLRIPVLAVLAACSDGITQQKTGGPPDVDEDGVDSTEDCDDDDPLRYPGAEELCDGIDNDCDGMVDTDDTDLPTTGTWYEDLDGDGFGDEAARVSDCAQPSGTVSADAGFDCDDSDATVNPDGTESCDTVADDDCDGSVNDADALDCTVYYADADDDGYAGTSTTTCLCYPEGGYVGGDPDDCDDEDANISPAVAERCDDDIDNNCDGDSLECRVTEDMDLTDRRLKLEGEALDNAAGTSLGIAGDVDSDGRIEIFVHAPGVGGGAAYLSDAHGSGELSLDGSLAVFLSESDSSGGGLATGLGDTNGDGALDFAVGDPTASAEAGTVRVWLGPVSGAQQATSSDALYQGLGASQAGSALAGADFDGDGAADLVLGAPGRGMVFLVMGPLTTSGDVDVLGHEIRGGGEAGAAVTTAGDIDGDGIVDLLLADPSASLAWLLQGPVTAVSSVSDAYVLSNGGGASGTSLAGGGDLTGDGLDDLVIGAPGADEGGSNAGAVYVVAGPVTTDVDLSVGAFALQGEKGRDALGTSVSIAGDLDDDGFDDLIVGAPGEDTGADEAGGAYVLHGPLTASRDVGDVAALIEGTFLDQAAGTAVLGPGDVDGDGIDDLVVGAPGDPSGGRGSGAAFVLLGRGL